MWAHRASLALAAVLTLCCAAARSDDARRTPPEDPDPGFLEFLGSVDRLSDVNPDYIAQAEARAKAAAANPPANPPPPRPPVPPPNAANGPGAQKNE